MSAVAVVLYENKEDGKFDLDYYLSTHMPLVAKHWGPLGLKRYQVNQLTAGLEGAKPPYRVQCVLYWDSEDSIEKAVKSDSAQHVFGDVPNFTNIGPTFIAGQTVGQEST